MSSPDDGAPPVEPPAESLTTAMIADSLDRCGYRHQVVDPAIVSMGSAHQTRGRARTIRFVPTEVDPSEPYQDMIDAIDDLRDGDLVVIVADGAPRSAVWGELFSAAAVGRGSVGLICDGWIRDVAKIRDVGFAVHARGALPVDYRGRQRVAERDTAVVCGGVRIEPGDLVVADEDGIVVVPQSAEDEALGLANRRARGERSVLDELLAGASLHEVWQRHGIL